MATSIISKKICTLCEEDLKPTTSSQSQTVVQLQCSHIFHRGCAEYLASHHMTCPDCQTICGICLEDISQLKKRVIKKIPTQSLDADGERNLAIILRDCGHAFCASCIRQELTHRQRCPTCRQEIQTDIPLEIAPQQEMTAEEILAVPDTLRQPRVYIRLSRAQIFTRNLTTAIIQENLDELIHHLSNIPILEDGTTPWDIIARLIGNNIDLLARENTPINLRTIFSNLDDTNCKKVLCRVLGDLSYQLHEDEIRALNLIKNILKLPQMTRDILTDFLVEYHFNLTRLNFDSLSQELRIFYANLRSIFLDTCKATKQLYRYEKIDRIRDEIVRGYIERNFKIIKVLIYRPEITLPTLKSASSIIYGTILKRLYFKLFGTKSQPQRELLSMIHTRKSQLRQY